MAKSGSYRRNKKRGSTSGAIEKSPGAASARSKWARKFKPRIKRVSWCKCLLYLLNVLFVCWGIQVTKKSSECRWLLLWDLMGAPLSRKSSIRPYWRLVLRDGRTIGPISIPRSVCWNCATPRYPGEGLSTSILNTTSTY